MFAVGPPGISPVNRNSSATDKREGVGNAGPAGGEHIGGNDVVEAGVGDAETAVVRLFSGSSGRVGSLGRYGKGVAGIVEAEK